MSYRLYIPGPLTVSDSIVQAMAKPMVGHRSGDFVKLYNDMQPRLQSMFYTQDPVYLSTSSAWGVMEGALRNVCRKGVLNCMNGAFSDKWNDVAKRCGKYAEALQFDWGKPVDPEAVRKALATGKFDCITFIHSETSTGTLSPIADIMAVVREFPDVISIADTVSSFSTLPIAKDQLGVDILLTGSQKALALPPGLAIFAVSERARERADRHVRHRARTVVRRAGRHAAPPAAFAHAAAERGDAAAHARAVRAAHQARQQDAAGQRDHGFAPAAAASRANFTCRRKRSA